MANSPILQALYRANQAYRHMTTRGELLDSFTFDDTSQLFCWVDTQTARFIFLKSNGSFDHSEGIPADGRV